MLALAVANVMAINSVRANDNRLRRPRRRWHIIKRALMAVAFIALVAVPFSFDYYSGKLGIVLPQAEITETTQGRVIKVPPGGNLQAAVDKAVGGDIIELQAGAVYAGQITLPNKPLTDFVTIQTSAVTNLPEGKRVSPSQRASMATINPGLLTRPAILAANGAHHYRFIGIEFGPTTKGYFNIIQIGTTEETSVEQLPHHIEFDRVYVHGDPKLGQRRGIAANGRHIKITNSYFSDFKREGEESQAIAVWAADGPIEITNNYIEAAAENILFGGAMSKLALIPGNAIIRDNWLNKPIEWRNTKWVVKNLFEIKSGRNIRVENNLMTNNWGMAQEGHAIVFFSASDSGERAVVEDIEFVNNIVRGSASAMTIAGGEAGGGRRVTIRNNVFEDIDSKKWDGRGFFLKPSSWDGLVIENNTVIHDGSITIAYGGPIRGFIFRNNIVFNNEYSFFGDGIGVGKPALVKYFPGSTITNNAIIGGDERDYGKLNFYPRSINDIGFANPAANDYRLRGDSQYKTRNIGANLDPKTVGAK